MFCWQYLVISSSFFRSTGKIPALVPRGVPGPSAHRQQQPTPPSWINAPHRSAHTPNWPAHTPHWSAHTPQWSAHTPQRWSPAAPKCWWRRPVDTPQWSTNPPHWSTLTPPSFDDGWCWPAVGPRRPWEWSAVAFRSGVGTSHTMQYIYQIKFFIQRTSGITNR